MWCLLFGCKCNNCDDVPTETEDRFYPNIYRNLMPFSGSEKLYYKKNGTDTIAFIGSGKQVYYNEVTRGGGNCPITYRLLNHKLNFVSSQLGNIQFWYYRYSETNAFDDYYELYVNESTTGRLLVLDMYDGKAITLKVNGIDYPVTKPMKLGQMDSVYINFSDTDAIKYKILRFRYHNDVYEVLP
jgi:hypothetical protein